jgi:hypothetical protein
MALYQAPRCHYPYECWHACRGKSAAQRAMEKAMGPDHSREGVFVYHNCSHCDDGKKPCPKGNPRNCENLHARND